MIGRSALAALLVLLLSGCLSGEYGDTQPPNLPSEMPDSTPDTSEANDIGNTSSAEPGPMLRHTGVVLFEDCYGGHVGAAETRQTAPWSPPPGWEPSRPGKVHFDAYALRCSRVDNGGLALLHDVAWFFEGHDNLEVPEGALGFGYDGIVWVESFITDSDALNTAVLPDWNTPATMDLSVLRGGRDGVSLTLDDGTYSSRHVGFDLGGNATQDLRLVLLFSTDPLEFWVLEESYRSDFFVVSASIQATEPFAAARLTGATSDAGAHALGSALVNSSYTLTRWTEW